jgi:hypothetical protein
MIMGRRRFKPEQIIHMLREAVIKLAAGSTTPEGTDKLKR